MAMLLREPVLMIVGGSVLAAFLVGFLGGAEWAVRTRARTRGDGIGQTL